MVTFVKKSRSLDLWHEWLELIIHMINCTLLNMAQLNIMTDFGHLVKTKEKKYSEHTNKNVP